MALVEIKVPDIGDFDEVAVIELLVKPGDAVTAEQSLITVESDKASMEIPSSAAGVVKELLVKIGDKVKQGSAVLTLEAAGAAAAAPPVPVQPALVEAPPPVAAAPSASGTIDVAVPDIGDFKDVAVIEVFVKPGDTVKVEQSLITVESDKASMEIPSSHGGVVKSVLVKVGDKVNMGSPLVVLEGSAGAAATAPVPASAPVRPEPVEGPTAQGASTGSARTDAVAMPSHEPSASKGTLPHASPSIRKFARELGVPLTEVKGSGPKGRITQTDVQGFVKGVMAGDTQTAAQKGKAPAGASAGGAFPGLLPWPQVDFSKFGETERKDLSRIKKISGANLHRNWVVIPHVTNHDDADITELEAFRVATNKENEKSGVKVTMLAFLIKASVAALKKFPEFNSSLVSTDSGEQLVLKKYFHIGFAADTPNGLVVPVIKDADKKGVIQISTEMGELAKKARDGKLGPADMSGACFTISSLGGIGGRYFTPIINAPEVSILGVCKSAIEPKWDGKAFVPRLMLPLSLSWDHRVIDGASAARFNAYLGQILADFRRVLL
jgi:pyruvate dehydrogenase E2 component (dihydrolipoamide acetyltransferase)